MKIFIIAWRNIWRNKRRTFITIASVSAALFFALIMRAFQDGSYEKMIYNVVHSYTGHIQIHADGYQDNQSIDNAFEYNDSIADLINVEGVEKTMLQLTSGGAVSYKNLTKFAMILCGNPEQDLSENLLENIVYGESLQNNDNGIILSEGLAKYLKIITYDTLTSIVNGDTLRKHKARLLADSLVVSSQGMYGESAYGLFKIKAILKYPDPKMNNGLIYMPLQLAQQYLSAQNMLTSIAIVLKDDSKQEEILKQYKEIFTKPDYEVLSWQSMNEELLQQIKSDKGSGMIIIFILYLIIGFGIFGTIVMMTAERKKEFAVMIALGMKRKKLIRQFFVEIFYMGSIGIITGAVAVSPVLAYFYYNPIRYTGEMAEMIESYGMEAVMPVSCNAQLFINHAIVVFLLFALASLYTRHTIKKLDVIKSIRS